MYFFKVTGNWIIFPPDVASLMIIDCPSPCKEIWIYVFPEKELRGLGPNFYLHIHVSVSDLRYIYIPRSAE
jgi:hypothetical protein